MNLTSSKTKILRMEGLEMTSTVGAKIGSTPIRHHTREGPFSHNRTVPLTDLRQANHGFTGSHFTSPQRPAHQSQYYSIHRTP